MKKFYLQKFLISFFMIFLFGVFGYSQKYENLEQEKLKIENSKVTKVKSVNFSNKLKTINLEKAGALKLRDNISVLVASPNASEFNYLLIPLLKEFETDGNTINYTTTYDLASLTVEEMLDYHVVVTFNYEQWDQFITGLSSPIEWSDKLGEYIDSNGRLIEFEFVQDFDEWGLGGGAYINENKSPFTKATADVSGYGGSMGNVAQPDHPIMSGVTNVSTDYFYQNVTVRDNATLIASYTDGHPLCAINDQIVAFNIHPIGFYGTEWDPFIDVALKEDGCKMFYNSIVYLYNSIAPVGSPNFVTDVVVTPDSLGGNSINLSWKNPTLTAQDEPLTSLTSINIYINDDDTPAHIITNPVIGGAESWTATNLDYGVISFAIVGENENGEGKPYEVSSFVGLDAPAAVTDLTVTNSGSDGILSWTAPTIGINNGAIGSSTINYTIIRLPDNVTVATNYTSTTFTDNTIAELGFYAYKVIASNAQGEGGNATSNTEMLGPSIILPYLMGFEEDEQYDIWTIIDNNDDGSSWSRQTNTDNYEGYAMRYYYSTSNNADDWLITPRIYLENGKSYTLKFKARKSSDSYTEKFKVFLGTGLNIEDFTTQLFDVETSDQEITTEYQDFVINTNTIENSGGYHFAVQATSDINQFFLFVDDFEIFETLNNDIKAISLIAPKRALVGEEIELKVNLENIGSEIASGYSIKILDDNDNIIATSTLENSIDIEPNGIVTIPILYTPEDEGELSIYAKVEYAEDTNLSNNETEPITIYILPNQDGTAITQIGYGDYKSDNLPINFFYKNSFSQVIYKQNDISVTQGDVVGLTYIYSFANTLENKNIKIWLANTNKECFNSNTDWIPQSEFELVFDGTVDIESGEGLLDFELIPNAFSYTGGNIAIMVEKLDNSYKYGCNFYQTKTDTNNNVSIYYRKDSDPFDWSQEGTLVNCFPNIILTFNNVQNDDPTPECNEVQNLVATVEGNNVTLTWEDPVVKGGEVVLTEDFEAQTLPEDWTIIDADGDGYNWEMANYNSPEFSGANASSNFVNSASYINLVGPQTPDNYLITPELDLTEGGTLTYWVSAQDASYPDDHYGIFYSTTGNSVEDFVDTPLFEETITAKQVGPKGDRGTNMMGVWYQRTVELPVGTKYVAFRHYNCTDAYRINIDDVEITSGGNNGPISEFTFNIYKDGVLLTTTQSLTYEDVGLSEGTYNYCVEVVCDENTTSDQVCVEATVTDDSDCNPVQNLVATVNNDVVTLTWDNPVFIGREVVLTEDFENGVISSDWTIIDSDGDGNNWFVYDYQYGSPHTGFYGVTSESYINSVGPQTPDNYLITPELNLTEGGTLTYWVSTQDASYPSEHYGIFYSTTGNSVEDFGNTPLFEETITAKHVGPKGLRGTNDQGAWYQRTVTLPKGTNYIAFRHYNCTNAFRINIDDIEITDEGGNVDPPVGELTFNIYRDGELLDSTTEMIYEDVGLEAGTYNYCVEVVCEGGSLSDQVCVDATIENEDDPECNPVQNLESSIDEDIVTLTWEEPINTNKDSYQITEIKYNVYRDNELLGSTQSLTYKDIDVEDGIYNYCVEVVCGDNLISDQVCISVEVNTIGIQDNSSINIYPNPSKDIVTINGVDVDKVYVYNQVGQLVEVLNSNVVNVSSYVCGVYIFNIVTLDGILYKAKVVVK